MNERQLLAMGAQMRHTMLDFYARYGADEGVALTRRYLLEMGDVLVDMHGLKDAAAVLYDVADAATLKLPIESYHLPVPAESQTEELSRPCGGGEQSTIAPKMSLYRRIGSLVDRHYLAFISGVACGLWLGGRS
ncbi:MAG TPA: hypothetical protein VHZ78_08715 [Rhizomicrobium sp.]|jgi:hypothetical protein|nr:hypothetical protein [Rhizomicrobium sp.]